MYYKIIILAIVLNSTFKSIAQNFGYQGRKFEVNIGTEVTTNPTYAYYARFGESNDEQSGLGLSFAPVIGLNYAVTKRFGLGISIARQNLFVGYRTPDAGVFLFSIVENGQSVDDFPFDAYNIPFRIVDKNRYRSLLKTEINLRYYVNKNIGNASSYFQLGFGVYNVAADDNEVYTYGFYQEKGAPESLGDVESTITLDINEFVSNTKIPTFKYISFGYFFRKEFPFMDGLFFDLGITLAPLIRHPQAEETSSRGRSTFEFRADNGITDEAIETYIITNTWMYVRRQQGIKTHLKISYLF